MITAIVSFWAVSGQVTSVGIGLATGTAPLDALPARYATSG